MNEPPEDAQIDALYQRVRADLSRERGVRAWLRARSTARRAAALGATALAAIAIATSIAAGPGALVAPRGEALASLAGLLAAVGVAIAVWIRPIDRPGRPWSGRVWLAGLGAGAVAAVLAVWDGHLGVVGTARCLWVAAVAGTPVLVVGYMIDRTPRRNLALAGLVAALTGITAAQAVCPLRGLAHLLADHVAALVVLSALFTGARWMLGRLERA